MPRKSKFPRLRSHVRKGKGGQRWVYYFYDMRPEGEKDVPLGKDHAEAIRQWEVLHIKRPASRGLVLEAIDRWRKEVLPSYESKVTKRNYTSYLNGIEKIFGQASWAEIGFPELVEYVTRRSASAAR